jgi:hypothetical protein
MQTHDELVDHLGTYLTELQEHEPRLAPVVLHVVSKHEDGVSTELGGMYVDYDLSISVIAENVCEEETEDLHRSFLHECGHVLFLVEGDREGMQPLDRTSVPDVLRSWVKADHCIHEYGAEVQALLGLRTKGYDGWRRKYGIAISVYEPTLIMALKEAEEARWLDDLSVRDEQNLKIILSWAQMAVQLRLGLTEPPMRPTLGDWLGELAETGQIPTGFVDYFSAFQV